MVARNRVSTHDLPPGFRFHPTDEELIIHYLKKQATSTTSCPVSTIIPVVDIYKFDPWQLPDKSGVGENEWYFFTPRDRKYPNGVRPNRAALSGYWKATGTDKGIFSGSRYVGVKKALVFYRGRPPKGIKTDWIMHEYRLSDSRPHPYKQNGSMRLDDWVLCRIYKKKKSLGDPQNTTGRNNYVDRDNTYSFPQIISHTSDHHNHIQKPQSNQFLLPNPNPQTKLLSFPRNIIHSLWDLNTSSSPQFLNSSGSSIQHMMRGEDFLQAEGKYQVGQVQGQHQPMTFVSNPAFQMQ